MSRQREGKCPIGNQSHNPRAASETTAAARRVSPALRINRPNRRGFLQTDGATTGPTAAQAAWTTTIQDTSEATKPTAWEAITAAEGAQVLQSAPPSTPKPPSQP